jgi:glycine cleavage system H protein
MNDSRRFIVEHNGPDAAERVECGRCAVPDIGARVTYPAELVYHPEHDWARIEADEATFGLTAYAQDQLGEVVFFEPPPIGTPVFQGKPCGELESVKAVSDVIAPLSGEVVAVNSDAVETPDLVNTDPYGAGWLIRVRLSDPAEASALLDADSYRRLVTE